MNSRITIQDELRRLDSELSADLNGTPYSVPQSYFENLADSILLRIKNQNISAAEEINELSPLLAALSKKMPFSLPQDYFRTSIEDIPLITSDDKESAMLSFIGKEMPYEVPSGFFESLPREILSKVYPKKAKVVSFRRKAVRMMAAAAVIGVMAVAGIFYFGDNGTSGTGNTTTPNVAVELKQVSTEALNEFIETTDVDITDDKAQVTAKNTSKPKEAKKIFQDVTDEELEAFLDQLPTDKELMD